MRIAAGVLLIIVAVLNLFAGFTYLAGGALVGGATAVGADMAAEANAANQAEVAEAVNQGFLAGGALGLFGIFLLVLTGLLITAAVFLFRSTKAKFIFVVAALAILGELIGAYLTSDLGITNIFGLVAGALAFYAATTIGNTNASPLPEAEA